MDRKRYDEDYSRSDTRRRETRDDRHGRERVEARDRRVIDDRMDIRDTRTEARDRMDTTMDSRLAPRMDPVRANASVRVQPPSSDRDRFIDPRAREPELYKDPRTGELRDPRTGDRFQEIPSSRHPYTRDDRMDREPVDRMDRMDRDDIPPPSSRRTRDVVDLGPSREYEDDYRPSGKYNDYFVPGTGIDREVIQHEICRYLGNDATVRPFTNKDGRQGFVVRAYRALTSAMIEDLKRDSLRWRQEQDRRQRAGRSTGMIYMVECPLNEAEEITVSYADMKGRQEVESYGGPDVMDVDDDFPPSRRHDVDPRGVQPSGRHITPVSSGFAPEPGYYVSSTQQSNYGPETLPRSHADYRSPGGSTPPTSRAGQSTYGQPAYPPRTTATAPPVPASYRDPRTGQMVGYEPSYPTESRRRHQ